MIYTLFPKATIVHFKDGSKAACDTDGSHLISLLRRSHADTEIAVKYGRAVVLRPISDVDMERMLVEYHETARASE